VNTREIGTIDHTLKHSILEVHIRNRHIEIEVGLTRPSTYFIYQKIHRLVPSTCSPIRGHNLVWKGSCFAGHMMRNPLVIIRWLGTHICAHFVLVPPWFSILDARNTHLGLERLKTFVYVLSPHLTSHALTSNVSSTPAPTSAADTILPPAITSDATDWWQCDPWLKHRFAVYNIKWWTSGRHELTWLWFFQLISMLLVQWSLSLLYEKNAFSFFKEFWNVSEQLPNAKIWNKY